MPRKRRYSRPNRSVYFRTPSRPRYTRGPYKGKPKARSTGLRFGPYRKGKR